MFSEMLIPHKEFSYTKGIILNLLHTPAIILYIHVARYVYL